MYNEGHDHVVIYVGCNPKIKHVDARLQGCKSPLSKDLAGYLKIETSRQTNYRLFGKHTAFLYHDTLAVNTA